MIKRPGAILALLTGLNFLNYLDRMIVAAVLPSIIAELGLSGLQAGLLATVFLLGYFITAPMFGALADKGRRKGLIAVGVLIWSVATAASGIAAGFWTLVAARAVVGVGEASYATLAPTIIDDQTPPDKKGSALAIFYLAMPLGSAAGYLIGGYVGKHYGWRTAFFVGGGPGVVLALSCLLIVEPQRKLAAAKTKLVDGLRRLARLPLFRRSVLGYCAQTWAVGAFAFWAPTFLVARFPIHRVLAAGNRFWLDYMSDWLPGLPMAPGDHAGLDVQSANFFFGVVTVVAGTIGTVIGGKWADLTRERLPAVPTDAPYDAPANQVGINAQLKICAVGMLLAVPFGVACFVAPTSTLFFAFAFMVEVGVFMAAAPVNTVALRAVPVELRASAMAASIFAIHLLGDLWSPPALGLLMDTLPFLAAMMILPIVFLISGVVWWPRAREATAT